MKDCNLEISSTTNIKLMGIRMNAHGNGTQHMQIEAYQPQWKRPPNLKPVRVCGDPSRGWGSTCPPRVALVTTEEILAGVDMYWDKRSSDFDPEDLLAGSEGQESESS